MHKTRGERKYRGPDPERDKRFERHLCRTLVFLVIAIAVIQSLQRVDSLRSFLNQAIRLEGVPLQREIAGLDDPAYPWLDLSDSGRPAGTIYIRLTERPKGEVWVLVNSRAVKLIEGDGGAVTVQHDDFVEVLSHSGDVRAVVSGASSNVEHPCIGIWVAGRGHVFLARVRLR